MNAVNIISTMLNLVSACVFDDNPKLIWHSISIEDQCEVLSLADKCGYRSILYYYLKDEFPKEFSRECKLDFISLAAKSIQREKAIGEIQQIFKENQIDFTFVKGAFAAINFYPSPALRYSSDIDLLVKNSDSIRAFTIAKAHGWKPIHEFFELNKQHFPSQIKKHVFLEIHTFLFGTIKEENQELWSELKKYNYNSELCLLHILHHALRHHNFLNITKAILDVGFILKTKTINWEYFRYLEKKFLCSGLLDFLLNSFPEFFSRSGIIPQKPIPKSLQNSLKNVVLGTYPTNQFDFLVSDFSNKNMKSKIKTLLTLIASLKPAFFALKYNIPIFRAYWLYPFYFCNEILKKTQKYFTIKYSLKHQEGDTINNLHMEAEIYKFLDQQNHSS